MSLLTVEVRDYYEVPSINYEFDAVLDNGLLKATIPTTESA
ncbi:hypothetical protein [Spirosoma sp.]|nr:hypothetical protein [Spirosoma sp.]MCX6216069.1 hypothetical protein [Spirosoma sp.]